MLVTRRHMLEWTPAAQATAGKRLALPGFALRMSGALGVAVVVLVVALLFGRGAWPVAAPFVALWLVSPAVALRISLPAAPEKRAAVSDAEARMLRRTARRTWRYFETFVTAADNWLPPDNFQEDPAPALAHRTSPTNIGLYLLCVVAARDFGWIGADSSHRPPGGDVRDDGADGQISRSFLQLVRDARPQRAGAQLRVFCR